MDFTHSKNLRMRLLMVLSALAVAALLLAGQLSGHAAAYTNPSKEEIRQKLYDAAVARNIPPEILYGIAYQESGWRQFDANGDPLIGYDGIGIGIMQISSYGSYDIEQLKYDIDYNIDAGAEILMEKWWNTPSIGDDAMDCYENWFYAVWAYNGWVAYNTYPYTVWSHIADSPMGWWAGVSVTPVPQEWLVNGFGVQIETPQPAHYWSPPLTSWFSWYDSASSSNWILVGNPSSAGASTAAQVSIAGIPKTLAALPGQGAGVVPPGNTLVSTFPGVMNGPVAVSTSRESIISQRMRFGDSIEEITARPEADLSSHYYWPWYDQKSPGFSNWILIANPNEDGIFYRITLAGTERGSGILGPGKVFTPQLDGEIGGPLEVEAWTDETGTVPADVIASQRVLSGNGKAFNEAPGIPEGELSTSYVWTWYDDAGGDNWILLANPNGQAVDYRIEIGEGGCDVNPPAGTACGEGTLAAAGDPGGNDVVTPRFGGVMNGPVRVTAQGGNIIASQRVVFGDSFGETPGYRESELSGEYHWTWYDQLSPGMQNWILVANPGESAVHYTIRINGIVPAGYEGRTLAAGVREMPVIPDWRGGPVEVSADGDLIASQRLLYKGYFNEVPGTVLP